MVNTSFLPTLFHDEPKLLKMFSNANSEFIKAVCKAFFAWNGNPSPHCTCSHIHGVKDLVIYPPKTGATLIGDGEHLIAITHEEEVAEFIKQSITA